MACPCMLTTVISGSRLKLLGCGSWVFFLPLFLLPRCWSACKFYPHNSTQQCDSFKADWKMDYFSRSNMWDDVYTNFILCNWTINKRASLKYFHSQWNSVVEGYLFINSFPIPEQKSGGVHFISSLGYCQYKSFKVSENLSLLSFSVSCLFCSEWLGAMWRLLGSPLIKKVAWCTAHKPSPQCGNGGVVEKQIKEPWGCSGRITLHSQSESVVMLSYCTWNAGYFFTSAHQCKDVLLSSPPLGLTLWARD